MALIPGVTDMPIAEPLDYPSFKVKVDRAKALERGVTEQQVASGPRSSLSGNTLISPNYWLDPVNGVNYNVVTQAPIQTTASVDQIANTPLTNGTSTQAVQFLGNVASISHTNDPAVVAHYTVQRVIDVDCGVSGRDLGSTTNAVQKAIDSLGKLPAGTHVVIRGQSQAMNQSFKTMGLGLILAIVLVYLLMVANFQSWLEPFIIIMAVPGALAGVLWMLVFTGTTINVESLMGAIMAGGGGGADGEPVLTVFNHKGGGGGGSRRGWVGSRPGRLRPL